jgi:hypothetical protein
MECMCIDKGRNVLDVSGSTHFRELLIYKALNHVIRHDRRTLTIECS